MKPNLRLLDSDEPSCADVALAAIEQDQSEWSGPCGKTDGWQPITTDATNPLPVDAIQGRSYKVVITNSPIPFWRRVMRWLEF